MASKRETARLKANACHQFRGMPRKMAYRVPRTPTRLPRTRSEASTASNGCAPSFQTMGLASFFLLPTVLSFSAAVAVGAVGFFPWLPVMTVVSSHLALASGAVVLLATSGLWGRRQTLAWGRHALHTSLLALVCVLSVLILRIIIFAALLGAMSCLICGDVVRDVDH